MYVPYLQPAILKYHVSELKRSACLNKDNLMRIIVWSQVNFENIVFLLCNVTLI